MDKKDNEQTVPQEPEEVQKEETAVPEAEAPAEEKPAPEKTKAEKKAEKKAELDTLREQLADVNDKHLRLRAEYDNYRRRSKQEMDSRFVDARIDTVKKFLPVYDNLARAAAQETDEEAKKGAEAILTQFKAVLEGMAVTEIEAVGKRFDPTLHEALLHIDDEKYGEGEIVLELEKGFKLGDKVIRFSKVQVAN